MYKQFKKLASYYKKANSIEEAKKTWENNLLAQAIRTISPEVDETGNLILNHGEKIQNLQKLLIGGGLGYIIGDAMAGKTGGAIGGLIGAGIPFLANYGSIMKRGQLELPDAVQNKIDDIYYEGGKDFIEDSLAFDVDPSHYHEMKYGIKPNTPVKDSWNGKSYSFRFNNEYDYLIDNLAYAIIKAKNSGPLIFTNEDGKFDPNGSAYRQDKDGVVKEEPYDSAFQFYEPREKTNKKNFGSIFNIPRDYTQEELSSYGRVQREGLEKVRRIEQQNLLKQKNYQSIIKNLTDEQKRDLVARIGKVTDRDNLTVENTLTPTLTRFIPTTSYTQNEEYFNKLRSEENARFQERQKEINDRQQLYKKWETDPKEIELTQWANNYDKKKQEISQLPQHKGKTLDQAYNDQLKENMRNSIENSPKVKANKEQLDKNRPKLIQQSYNDDMSRILNRKFSSTGPSADEQWEQDIRRKKNISGTL